VAEGGGLLNRYRLVKAYRGFESLRLRQFGLYPPRCHVIMGTPKVRISTLSGRKPPGLTSGSDAVAGLEHLKTLWATRSRELQRPAPPIRAALLVAADLRLGPSRCRAAGSCSSPNRSIALFRLHQAERCLVDSERYCGTFILCRHKRRSRRAMHLAQSAKVAAQGQRISLADGRLARHASSAIIPLRKISALRCALERSDRV
jgi:hypothetical protein